MDMIWETIEEQIKAQSLKKKTVLANAEELNFDNYNKPPPFSSYF